MVSWTAREIADALIAAGFVKLRQGATSHVVFRHPDGRQVTVSMHRRDVKDGTLSAIRRQSGLPFRKLGTMAKLFYRAVLEAASDGYNVFFPDFDGCTSGGDTLNDAAANAADALALHLEDWPGSLPEPSALNAPIDPEAEPAAVVFVPFETAAERELARA